MKWGSGDLTEETLKVFQHMKLHSVVDCWHYTTEDSNFLVIECLTFLWIEFLSLAVVPVCILWQTVCLSCHYDSLKSHDISQFISDLGT